MRNRRRILVAAAAGVVALAFGLAFMPSAPTLSSETRGDPDLIQLLQDSGPGHHLSVAVIDGDDVRVAHFGADDDTEYEAGSINKTLTGSLLAIAIERGEVEPDTTLGELLDLGDSPTAGLTLESLATQKSGLPALPGGIQTFLTGYWAQVRAGNPYPYDLDDLLEHGRTTEPGEPGEYHYSNLGFALLGHALAAAAGTDYATLVEERITGPLGMHATSIPYERPEGATQGYTASNRIAAPWTTEGYAPAAPMRSTLADLVVYAQAQLDGSAPGVAATEPITDVDDGRIGYAWFTTPEGVTWHNGMTGGFASWLGFDRDRDRAVVILSDTAIPRDALAFALMELP